MRKLKLPFKHVDRVGWFRQIIMFKLEESFLETGGLNQLFVVRIVKTLLRPEWDLSLHLLQRNSENYSGGGGYSEADHDLREPHVILVELI